MDRSVVLSVGDSYHLRFGKDRVRAKKMGLSIPGIRLESVFPQKAKQNKNRRSQYTGR